MAHLGNNVSSFLQRLLELEALASELQECRLYADCLTGGSTRQNVSSFSDRGRSSELWPRSSMV